MAQVQYIGTGRRKSSVARVRLVPGEGNIVINKRDVEDYVPYETLREIIKQPLVTTQTLGSYDVHVNVNGGGFTGQAGAIRHGIARALLTVDPDFRPALKSAGFLTRDPRMKERKNQDLKALVVHLSSQNVNIILSVQSTSRDFSGSAFLLVFRENRRLSNCLKSDCVYILRGVYLKTIIPIKERSIWSLPHKD